MTRRHLLITLLVKKREQYKLVINVLLDCVHSVKQPKRNAGVVMVRTTQCAQVFKFYVSVSY